MTKLKYLAGIGPLISHIPTSFLRMQRMLIQHSTSGIKLTERFFACSDGIGVYYPVLLSMT